MIVTDTVKKQVADKIKACIVLAEAHYGRTFVTPSLQYNLRGGCAGQAFIAQDYIKFNGQLLMENIDDFIARTVPHELAHMIDYTLHGIQRRGRKRIAHGDTWRFICAVIGMKDVTRCHSYDVSSSKRHKTKYQYRCTKCQGLLVMGPKQHAKQQSGASTYWHSGCRRAPIELVEQLGKVSFTEASKKSKAKQKREAKVPTLPTEPSKTRAPKTIKKANVRKLTKKQKALALYNKFINRSDMIKTFMFRLDMTKAGASTYYAMCVKENK